MSKIINYKSKPSIYGTGLIALDIVVSADTDEPAYQWAGGTCGNVLTELSYLGWGSFPIARLNDEASSLRVKKDMKQWGVRLDYSDLSPKASVPVITQEITKDEKGAPIHKFHWKTCPKCGAWLPNYKAVTLEGARVVKESVNSGDVYFFDRTSPGALDIARHFRNLGAIIFFEPSAKGETKHFEEVIKLADIIKYSDQRFSSFLLDNTELERPALEVQTLGGEGLKYRTRNIRAWKHLRAFKAEELVDTSGCGDWTTAGIISQLCARGRGNLLSLSQEDIEVGLKYGQALGAWNCGFKGARRGMYEVSKKTFKKEVELILEEGTQRGRSDCRQPGSEHASDGLCPACPH
jgi:sugar/nucleoside kinase (ribokinase family)